MVSDHLLSELSLPTGVPEKLNDLAVRGVRQLYARLRHDGPHLQPYLQLSDPAFAELYRKVEALIGSDYPEDLVQKVHPVVNKGGVAVDRLQGSTRLKSHVHDEE